MIYVGLSAQMYFFVVDVSVGVGLSSNCVLLESAMKKYVNICMHACIGQSEKLRALKLKPLARLMLFGKKLYLNMMQVYFVMFIFKELNKQFS